MAKVNRGRPREFDADSALDRAVEVFWRKGYEGASLTDLTEAMGINRPSLYAAFGDKETLFQKALERYGQGPGSYIPAALAQPTGKQVAEALLRGAARVQTNPETPPGCLTVTGALPSGEVRGNLLNQRMELAAMIERRLAMDLPAGADAKALTRFLITVISGMAVMAAGGATLEDLEPMIEMALKSWPENQ